MTSELPPSAAPDSRRFVFREGALVGEGSAPDVRRGPLAAADSWLVDAGRVRAIDLHRERFFGAAAAAGFDDETLLGMFWEAALGAIPPLHRWFPRQLHPREPPVQRRDPGSDRAAARGGEQWELALTMRIAPPLSGSVVLRTHRGADPRGIPAWKGPDLDTLASLRSAARADGVDDLVLLTTGGEVVEGTASALLWWRGDELRMPPREFERVDSVTARSVAAVAAAVGVPVREERATPAELVGTEVWAVNALHGIRVVSAWVGDGGGGGTAASAGGDRDPRTGDVRGGGADGAVAVVAEPGRAALWQRRLGALARPLPGAALPPGRS
ncbi:hypothetical protein C5B96_07595 [Subtercola sp. Z020]|uniref:aminotransferase class IV n=1 Tax=Subtercola sp. Z020 TaxID=2080582 RepID=UPI000CE863FB|nr:aminotransferase class IV [Subtercola sp. Z020]PPF84141.1 hypothetical protein C5B96_07595 [Subtercola sp. Z020]